MTARPVWPVKLLFALTCLPPRCLLALHFMLMDHVPSHRMAQDQDVTIYTDSRYAFAVVHDFGGIWHQRGFVTTDNKLISHASLIEDLIRASFLPSRLAIVKVRAHQRSSDPDSVGNNTADSAAKRGALQGPTCPFMNSASFSCAALTVDLLPGLDLDCIQATASDSDIKHWLSSGYDPAVKPLRDARGRLCLPAHCVLFLVPDFHGIDSDKGTPFTSKVTQMLAKHLSIDWVSTSPITLNPRMPHGKGLRAGLRDATPAARIPASHLQHQQYVCVFSRTTVTCHVMPHQLVRHKRGE
ncbi:hypothetical protein SRHO_G00112940 [Serrasalmus rhombeus]